MSEPIRLKNGEYFAELRRIRKAGGQMKICVDDAAADDAEDRGYTLFTRGGSPLQMRGGASLYVIEPPVEPEPEPEAAPEPEKAPKAKSPPKKASPSS